jgi:tRNA dimethylallyltransferase
MEEYSFFTEDPHGGGRILCSVPVHLVNVAEAGTKYNLFRYQQDFEKAYREVSVRGNVPILCGGSGLYIDAATRGYRLPKVNPDIQLRASLESMDMPALVKKLEDFKAARGDKPHNITDFDSKKRVIRAIEIEKYIDENGGPEVFRECAHLPQKPLFIGLKPDRDTRNARIDARLRERLDHGLVEEVRDLLQKGISPEDLIYYGLEYKYVTLYLTGRLSRNDLFPKLSTAIHQFAKRQMTWFRGMERKGIKINWIEEENPDAGAVLERILR